MVIVHYKGILFFFFFFFFFFFAVCYYVCYYHFIEVTVLASLPAPKPGLQPYKYQALSNRGAFPTVLILISSPRAYLTDSANSN